MVPSPKFEKVRLYVYYTKICTALAVAYPPNLKKFESLYLYAIPLSNSMKLLEQIKIYQSLIVNFAKTSWNYNNNMSRIANDILLTRKNNVVHQQ